MSKHTWISTSIAALTLLIGSFLSPVYAAEAQVGYNSGVHILFFDPRCSGNTTNAPQFKSSDEFLTYVSDILKDMYNKNPSYKPLTVQILCGSTTTVSAPQSSYFYDNGKLVPVTSGTTTYVPMPTPTMITPGVYPSQQSMVVPAAAGTTTQYASPGVVSAATITTNATSVTSGQSITVSWNGISNPTSTDFFGLYQGSNTSDTKAWGYTNAGGTCTQSPGNASSNGSCTFTIPNGLPSGSYTFRLYAKGNAGLLLATSPSFTVNGTVVTTPSTPAYTAPVTPTTTAAISTNVTQAVSGQVISVSWSNITNPTSTDWFGFYPVGSDNNSWKGWAYTNVNGTCTQGQGNASQTGTCTFVLPQNLPVGTYQVRLFSANTTAQLLAVSANILIYTPNAPTPTPTPVVISNTPQVVASTVTTNKAPVITTTQLKQATVGVGYDTQIWVTDENPTDSLNVRITTTELPRGLSFVKMNEYTQNNVRYALYELTGTPQNAERFNPEVTVTDSHGASTTKRFQMIVNNQGQTKEQTIKASQKAKAASTTTKKKNATKKSY